MATIKDVAKQANVSVSTVSIVINGHAKERKIPQVTIDKVIKAVQELNYRPNINARRLRENNNKMIIALYWPLDSRTNMLASLLSGFQNAIQGEHISCELIVKTYTLNHIRDSFQDALNNSFNGIIIGGTDSKDLDYLETVSINTPILLINRESKHHSTVSINDEQIIKDAISLLDYSKEIHVACSNSPFYAASQRTNSFIKNCKKNVVIHKAENTIEGGIQIANDFVNTKNAIVYCEDTNLALGIIYQSNKLGIKIPEDLSVFTLNYTDEHYTQYCAPSLTTISIPSEDIANCAVHSILELIKNKKKILHKTIQPKLFIRESLAK